jgi:hypothetical protein
MSLSDLVRVPWSYQDWGNQDFDRATAQDCLNIHPTQHPGGAEGETLETKAVVDPAMVTIELVFEGAT